MTRRILFVDDDPNVLDGLRAVFRRRRRELEMVFAPGGREALAKLHAHGPGFDVLVTDIDMPGIDGVALMRAVARDYPDTVRLALTGSARSQASAPVMQLADQILAKPCDPIYLNQLIDRACAVRDIIESSTLHALIGTPDTLPSLPRTYHALLRAIEDAHAGSSTIAPIIERDTAMVSKLFQLVHSAYFGLRGRVSTVQQAITFVGLRALKDLVLYVAAFGAFEDAAQVRELRLEALQDHTILVARIASRLVPASRRDEAFIAGLLHDVGYLVYASRQPERFRKALTTATDSGRPLSDVETEQYGHTHAESGAYLMDSWGLPYPIVSTIAHHHHAEPPCQKVPDLLAAVSIGDSLACGLGVTPGDWHACTIDEEWIASAGWQPSWRAWQDMAAAMEAGTNRVR